MNHLWLSLPLAVVVAATTEPPVAPAQGETQPTRAVFVHASNAWFLDINSDGSGRLQFGSSPGDGWSFKAGTFDTKKVIKDLEALASEKGPWHFAFHFESERKADKAPPARYTRDTKVIPALFETAIEAAQVRKQGRGALLLEKNPP